jgi:glutathione S-transferase
MSPLKLYNTERSGNCYKVRLLLAILDLNYQRIPVDLLAGESMTKTFKALNPRGQVPVLIDGDIVIWDSMAILVYLARQYGNEQWLPGDALNEALVMQWLAVSENELLYGLARARAKQLFDRPYDLAQCHQDAKPGLVAMERRLETNSWLASEQPTIADIACYPYVSLAAEGDFSLSPFPAVQAWLKRVEAIEGWLPMQYSVNQAG